MHLLLKTPVTSSVQHVWNGFDRSLFDQLSPPFPPVDVVRFDGCLKGDTVHLRLNFLLFKQDWISLITDQRTIETANRTDEIYFIDEGTQLPFFLAYWRHRHSIVRDTAAETGDDRAIIVDDITFRTPFRLTDYLFYPLLWLQFAYRKPIYRRIFTKKHGRENVPTR